MQAALRAGAAELARGLSTGIIVWSGSASFPDCTCAPQLSCPASWTSTAPAERGSVLAAWSWALALGLIVFLAGLVVGAAAASAYWGRVLASLLSGPLSVKQVRSRGSSRDGSECSSHEMAEILAARAAAGAIQR